jgi:hypothetical protein
MKPALISTPTPTMLATTSPLPDHTVCFRGSWCSIENNFACQAFSFIFPKSLAGVGRIRFFGGFRYAIFDWPVEDTVEGYARHAAVPKEII